MPGLLDQMNRVRLKFVKPVELREHGIGWLMAVSHLRFMGYVVSTAKKFTPYLFRNAVLLGTVMALVFGGDVTSDFAGAQLLRHLEGARFGSDETQEERTKARETNAGEIQKRKPSRLLLTA